MQAWFHDKGIGHAPKLRELEQQREEHRAEWQRLGQRIEEASLRVQHVRQQAHQRITAEQEPTLAKLAELEALQKEKARQSARPRRSGYSSSASSASARKSRWPRWSTV